jgi:hypothetical protein
VKRIREPRIDETKLVASHGPQTPMFVTIHDTESHDTVGIADLEGVANYWLATGRGYGAQIGIDKDGNSARYVNDKKIAWSTAGANTGNLSIELIGYASFGKAIWLLRPKQLEKCARWLAWWSTTYSIPLKLDCEHGISTHAMQTKYHQIQGGHTDPGIGFPLLFVVYRARQLVAQGGWA